MPASERRMPASEERRPAGEERRPAGEEGRPTGEDLFDRSEEYDAMLSRGLRLTGEGKEYYMRGRLKLLTELLPAGARPERILDFGCGIGDTSAALAEAFPEARIIGVDTAERALDRARERHGGPRTDFRPVDDLEPSSAFDLCYVNGVFHHIRPRSRPAALASIRSALRPGGIFAMFENNPWNPGTRMVMRRIPFDRDARTISPRAAVSLLRDNGFEPQGPPRHLFFFPAALAPLRVLEPLLRRLPLGGQYVVLATRPAQESTS